ncbi:MAG TPA: hypothetical protein VL689_15200 [Paraburkholderia sp.]|jgi:hypothetical protein|nr:hypothetical protein [Paraburkholderia sp.]
MTRDPCDSINIGDYRISPGPMPMADGSYQIIVTISRIRSGNFKEQLFTLNDYRPTQREACEEAAKYGAALVNGRVPGLQI